MMASSSRPGPFVRADTSPWTGYLDLGIRRSFNANLVLLHPGDRLEFLYYVQSGEILTTHFASPEDSHRISITGENAVAGIFELFSPLPPKTSWRTLRPTVCYLFSRECVERDLPRHLLLNLLEQSAFMGISLAGRFARGLDKKNDARLARFLLHFAESCPVKEEGGVITILPIVTQELSSELLGMHQVTFNKILAAFRSRGIIGKSKISGLQILDIRALAAIADGNSFPDGAG